MTNTRKGIKIEPTWKGVLPLLLATYCDGSPKGKQQALEEFRRMAEAADLWNAENKQEV